MSVFFSLMVGLIIGSFLNVCIYRIPLGRKLGPPTEAELLGEEEEALSEGEYEPIPEYQGDPVSMSYPKRSVCLACGTKLKWWHNIPLVSWLLLKGRCAFCETKISSQYPFVELLSGLSCCLAFCQYDFLTALVIYIFSCCLIVITFIDIKYYIIPDVITYPGMILGSILAIANHYYSFLDSPIVTNIYSAFWGLVLGGGFLLFVSEVYFRLRNRIGLGFGDVKLMAFAGILFGPTCAYYTIFIGSLCGSLIGVALLVFQKQDFTRSLPFGPYLALGAYIYLFVPIDWSRLLGF